MRLRRALAGLLAIPAALVSFAPAYAETIEVPGCYGAVVVVCDPAVEIVLPVGLEPFHTTIPVCAGTCIDVPVDAYTIGTNTDPHVCVKYEDRAGNVTRSCVPLDGGGTPSVTRCGAGEVGVQIRDGSGNDVFVYCSQPSTYSVGICRGSGAGVYITDEYGNTVLDACVDRPYVCKSPEFGVIVTGPKGEPIGNCYTIQMQSLYEICRSLAFSDPSLNCEIFRLDFIHS